MNMIEVDEKIASEFLPIRAHDGNKGSFGKTLLIVGSEKYKGAMLLCLESALRGGAGYTFLAGERRLLDTALMKFPEAIYREIPPTESLNGSDSCEIARFSEGFSSVVVGCGCGVSEGLFSLVSKLIAADGGPLIIDADAINAIATYSRSKEKFFSGARRKIILTPHPLELSRLCGINPEEINRDRVRIAEEVAGKYGVILLLKGNRTVITDGIVTYINTTGSSALAKGGSGDCLSGLIASLLAMGGDGVAKTVALAAFIHGKAGDRLAEKYSDFGVTPSDLPLTMAQEISALCKLK